MSTRISKSAIDSADTCPLCFWLGKRDSKTLKQPEGIRAGVPAGIDRTLKEHYDKWREKGELPPEIREHFPGWKLYDGSRISLKQMRYWGSGLRAEIDGAVLTTALDELLYHPEKKVYMMLDFKSKAKSTDKEATERFYGIQCDAYDLALNENGYPTEKRAAFAYYFPVDTDSNMATGLEVADKKGNVQTWNGISYRWGCQVICLDANHERAREGVRRTAKVIESDTPPKPGENCGFCSYIKERSSFLKRINESSKAVA